MTMGASHDRNRLSNMSVRKCTAVIGAEIMGLDLSRALPEDTFQLVTDALHNHGVICFRSQSLTPDLQVEFGRRFGSLEIHVLKQYALSTHPEILVLSNVLENGKPIGLGDAGTGWHSDTSFREKPDRASMLYAREVPVPNANGESAGDTLFANAQAAYEALDEGMKNRLSKLRALYSYDYFYTNKTAAGSKRAPLTEAQKKQVPDVTHPVVRTHPYTGKKSIYINPNHTVKVLDVSSDENAELMSFLFEHTVRPEFLYRHKWCEGDVLMWDNCVVQHKAIADYALPQRRLMHRVTVEGTAPF